MSTKEKSVGSEVMLARLCQLLDEARGVMEALPLGGSASQRELVDAVAIAHLCAQRLSAEQAAPKRRTQRRL